MKTIKAVGYIRVSHQDQADSGISLENQRAKIKAYAELKDLTLVEIIEDAGISAKNLKRDGIQRVLDMAKAKQIDAVIVFKLDRMFRSTTDALETTKLFDKWGVAFHSLQESLDTQSAMGRFFFTLTAALAEMERSIVGERTSTALQHKKANNERVGHIPFGYQIESDGIHLTENIQEQAILAEINILRGQGLSQQKIADELNFRLTLNRKEKKWNRMSVKRVAKL